LGTLNLINGESKKHETKNTLDRKGAYGKLPKANKTALGI
jgi:hypothetical protein